MSFRSCLLPIVAAWLVSAALATGPAAAQQPASAPARADRMTAAEELVWRPDPDFPEVDRALVHGSLRFAEPYVYRLRAYAPARLPLHAHPRTVYVTVLRGTLHHGTEKETRDRTRSCGPGCFLMIPPGRGHHGWLEPGTVVQVHGTGPVESLRAGAGPEG